MRRWAWWASGKQGQQSDHGNIQIPLGQRLAQSLLDVITDVALAHCAADVERHNRDHILGSLAGQNDATNLRTIAVNDSQFMAGGAQFCYIFTGLLDDFQLSLSSGRAVLGL